MATSEARIAANRRNAQKSTGPRTAEGKAASRVNAFRHGLAGAGDVLLPDEDEAQVAARALAIGRELGASGELGLMLARRVAVLATRVEESARRETVAVAANVAAARDRFDRDRLDEIDGWIADLDGDDPRPALAELEGCPEGLDHLASVWTEDRSALGAGDAAVIEATRRRLEAWLGVVEPVPSRVAGRVDAELARLDHLRGGMGAYGRAVAAARDEAGHLATFDPSPEAEAARRHEAAAERAMYRALKAIADLRRERERAGISPAANSLGRSTPTPTPPASAPRINPPAPVPVATLGSFRIGGAGEPPTPPAPPREPSGSDPDRRKRRPDLRKLAKNRR